MAKSNHEHWTSTDRSMPPWDDAEVVEHAVDAIASDDTDGKKESNDYEKSRSEDENNDFISDVADAADAPEDDLEYDYFDDDIDGGYED